MEKPVPESTPDVSIVSQQRCEASVDASSESSRRDFLRMLLGITGGFAGGYAAAKLVSESEFKRMNDIREAMGLARNRLREMKANERVEREMGPARLFAHKRTLELIQQDSVLTKAPELKKELDDLVREIDEALRAP